MPFCPGGPLFPPTPFSPMGPGLPTRPGSPTAPCNHVLAASWLYTDSDRATTHGYSRQSHLSRSPWQSSLSLETKQSHNYIRHTRPIACTVQTHTQHTHTQYILNLLLVRLYRDPPRDLVDPDLPLTPVDPSYRGDPIKGGGGE